MYMIFSWKVWAGLAAWIALSTWALVSLFTDTQLTHIRIIVIGAQGLIAFALWNPVWQALWKQFPQLGKWIYPDLNGTWEAHLETNWPVIDALRRAANGETERLDVSAVDKPSLDRPIFNVKIYQSWTKVGISLEGREGESVEIAVMPKRGGENEKHSLAYVFRQINPTPISTDASSFIGAAWIQISEDSSSMQGYYWTNREWHRGLNTAGRITLKRTS